MLKMKLFPGDVFVRQYDWLTWYATRGLFAASVNGLNFSTSHYAIDGPPLHLGELPLGILTKVWP